MTIYEELGVRPFLNAYRPLTRLGGATLPQPVIEAMQQASRHSVDLPSMQRCVGAAIAAMTWNEAAYVSCGAASGITLAIATCMVGTDVHLADLLPHPAGPKNTVVMHRCELGYKSDVAIRCAGATILPIGSENGSSESELQDAIDRHTAAIFVHDTSARGQLPLKRVIEVGRQRQVPVLVDAAFSVPPKDTLWRFTRDMGADAVFVSGGKGLRGPQSTGLVLGRMWIVNGCAFHGPPNDRIGRGMKVGKEELAGIYAAVKLMMAQDDGLLRGAMLQRLDRVLSYVRELPHVKVQRIGGPRAAIIFDSRAYHLTPLEAMHWLLNERPSVYVEPDANGLVIGAECLDAGDEDIVGRQLRALFDAHKTGAPP